MKTTLTLFSALLALALVAGKFPANRGQATVQKILGKEVYILSEPMNDYEIVKTLNCSLCFSDSKPRSMAEAFIKKANKQGETYDAIINDGGYNFVLIKFK